MSLKTIIIADSQQLIVEGLRTLLNKTKEYRVEKTAHSIDELYKQLKHQVYDILLIDNDFANTSTDVFKSIKELYPYLAIVIITNTISRTDFASVTKLGINAIVYKTIDESELLVAIDAAQKGRKHYSNEILDLLVDLTDRRKGGKSAHRSLTITEKDIVKLIAIGKTTKEIAHYRNVSFHTVVTHRKNIFKKLAIDNTTDLMRYAMQNNLVDNIDYHI